MGEKKGDYKPAILVLDDEPAVRTSFALSFPEYQFIGTDSPFEVLEILRSPNRIRLVVLDVVMPGINGISVLRQIRKVDPSIPVVICTGYGSKEVVIEALRAGANDYIEKPFNLQTVRGIFARLIKSSLEEGKDKVQWAYEMLREGFNKDINLEKVSSALNLSSKYLSRAFKERYGKRFTELKKSLRMEKARELLANTEMSITEVAIEVGFSCPEVFSRSFKEEHGITPSEYRSLFRSGGK